MIPPAPTDIDEALAEWGATCGPAAIAAALGVSIGSTRRLVCDLDDRGEPLRFKGYMGIRELRRALERAGVTISASGSVVPPDALLKHAQCPCVAMVQWSGSWDEVPRAAAAYRHVIALARAETGEQFVFDVNDDDWNPRPFWEKEIVPLLMPHRATGWRFSWVAEVLP
jgi:hypothetical protein